MPDPRKAWRVDGNNFLGLSERGRAATRLMHTPQGESVANETMPALYEMLYHGADWPGEPDGGCQPIEDLPDAMRATPKLDALAAPTRATPAT